MSILNIGDMIHTTDYSGIDVGWNNRVAVIIEVLENVFKIKDLVTANEATFTIKFENKSWNYLGPKTKLIELLIKYGQI